MTDTRDLDAAMHTVWKRGDWKTLTLYMTDGQREAAAAAVNRAGETSPYVRWWNMTYAKTGKTGIERFYQAIGKPIPPPLTPEERAKLRKAEEEAERMAEEIYGPPR